MLRRACAGLREWGAGARRELGLGRLQLPSVLASSSLPGTSATARHQAGPGRMGKLERTEVRNGLPFPLQGQHWPARRTSGSEPALVSGSSLEPDTR